MHLKVIFIEDVATTTTEPKMHGKPELSWGVSSGGVSKKKSKKAPAKDVSNDDDDGPNPFPFLMGRSSTTVYSSHNCIYFQDDITVDTAFALNKELRSVADKLIVVGTIHKTTPPPIWLHLTTNGGDIYAAFSVIDCIRHLGVSVNTVVDGFVASAGTLISVFGARRYIMPNAYMLLHELRSEIWGKFTDISDEMSNLKKIMDHIVRIYTEHTTIPPRQLEKLLKKDLIWNAEECQKQGVVDGVFTGYNITQA